ncbi:amino acid permease [Spirochaeta cellobiosiphila]|uniref:amino acid permease n=1 Tax=Spirochaeta cellobiosiphila TaxID=504483 RepID=UPI0004242920|nr:amino acid permease [Spirochaeta cellobiosiphila]
MKKFGTFSGVFVPSFEAILGAVLFLILPNLVGRMGIIEMIAIIVLSNTATLATAFSISDCTTNLQNVGPGGMYAIAKRSLGKAFGGSIGIQLFLAQSVSIGFYCIGFATPLQPIISKLPFVAQYVDQMGLTILEQKQVIATIIALISFIAAIAGADFIVKIQMVIFLILSVSVGAIMISPLINPVGVQGNPIFTDTVNWRGVMGGLGFWAAFTMFFPAVTGIDAGVGMSGSLKDPRKSLGKGTFTAIGITTLIYLAVVVVFSLVEQHRLIGVGENVPDVVDLFRGVPFIPVILLMGILFATGSSALSYFMTAPRTSQALANDNILPKFLNFLARDFTPNGKEPRWATVLTLAIVIPIIWSGDVGTISTVVGICFLVVYGWVNLAAFFERISGNPSFRPTNKGHWSISLYGFLVCMMVIAMFNIIVGALVFASQLLIFLLLLRFKSNNKLEGVWWGLLFRIINWGNTRIGRIIQGTKNWRPIVGIFCFSDRSEESEQALIMSEQISRFKGMSLVNVLKAAKDDEMYFTMPKGAQILDVDGDDYSRSIISVSQAAIPGGLSMNTVILPVDSRLNFTAIIEKLVHLGKNVLLMKPGKIADAAEDRIDVWWKGKENGNLMALLSYIISESEHGHRRHIRVIRKLFHGELEEKARQEMTTLLDGARLKGEVLILPESDESFQTTLEVHSSDANLILMGMPGQKAGGLAKMFSLDKMYFTKELEKYEKLPPVLFVKAASIVDLLE